MRTTASHEPHTRYAALGGEQRTPESGPCRAVIASSETPTRPGSHTLTAHTHTLPRPASPLANTCDTPATSAWALALGFTSLAILCRRGSNQVLRCVQKEHPIVDVVRELFEKRGQVRRVRHLPPKQGSAPRIIVIESMMNPRTTILKRLPPSLRTLRAPPPLAPTPSNLPHLCNCL